MDRTQIGVQVGAEYGHIVGLKSDGTLNCGSWNVCTNALEDDPAAWNDITQIATSSGAGVSHDFSR